MPSAKSYNPVLATVAVDPYRTLGLERSADEAAIKRAYFQLVRQFPPEQAPEKFQEIRSAYELLRVPASKARVDLFLIQPPPALPKRRRAAYDLSVHFEDLLTLALDAVATPIDAEFR